METAAPHNIRRTARIGITIASEAMPVRIEDVAIVDFYNPPQNIAFVTDPAAVDQKCSLNRRRF